MSYPYDRDNLYPQPTAPDYTKPDPRYCELNARNEDFCRRWPNQCSDCDANLEEIFRLRRKVEKLKANRKRLEYLPDWAIWMLKCIIILVILRILL